MIKRITIVCIFLLGAAIFSVPSSPAAPITPAPPGKLVNLGGHRLHVYCTGKGPFTVVVENGLGEHLVHLGLAKPFLAYSEWEDAPVSAVAVPQ